MFRGKSHYLDIIGENDGYFACIRFDDFKFLSKKEPNLVRGIDP